MFGFFKKTKPEVKKEARRIYIPKEHIHEVLEKYDNYVTALNKGHMQKRYVFWKAAEKYCPEIKEGEWCAKFKNGTRPFFLEILPD